MSGLGLAELKDLYGRKPIYFKHPLWSNTPYKYELASFEHPHNFQLKLKNEFTADCVTKLDSLLQTYREAWDEASLFRGSIFTEKTIYEGMPVIYTFGNSDCSLTLLRAEIKKFYKTKEKVDLEFIDVGEIHTTEVFNVYPITLDILRIPRMTIPCSLAFVYPKSGKWPDDLDVGYVNQFRGDSQIVYFHDVCPRTGLFNVTVEVNDVSIALRYFHDAFADTQPTELPVVQTRANDPPAYPINDFTPWIGFKANVFGVKAFIDGQQWKCVLQMNIHMVNTILDKIAEYVANTSEEAKQPPVDIAPGVCCIAKWEGLDYFRVRVLSLPRNGKVMVEYVDYKETEEVKIIDLLKMPDELLTYPEGARVCVISDFMKEPCKDVVNLKELVKDKNLYAFIHECDPNDHGAELKVFLFNPTGQYSAKNISFSSIFGVNKTPTLVKRLLQDLQQPTEAQAEAFLKQDIHQGEKFTLRRRMHSIWMGSEDKKKFARITSEMTEYYTNFTANPHDAIVIVVGSHVAAKKSDDQNNWYRAKVIEKRGESVKLLYIDLFKEEWVKTKHVFPMNRFFTKDSKMVFQTVWK